jgi:CheY-like chemotaxis protein
MLKILLIEDNEMNRDMLSRRLVKRGYDVAIAVDGEQGVAMARSEAPALILMDMSLPGLDGWDATRQIKAAPETRAIPVIALTAHAMSGDREKAIAAGCDDFDTKPVDLARLLEKIEALLGRPPAREHRSRRAAPSRAAHAAQSHHRLYRDAPRGARRRGQARAGHRACCAACRCPPAPRAAQRGAGAGTDGTARPRRRAGAWPPLRALRSAAEV